MKNEKLIAAKAYLRQQGWDEMPDATILGLFEAVKDQREAVYEPGDFVYFRFGMGEAGHGTVKTVDGKGYQVDVWYPEQVRKTEKPWITYVGGGDMIGLSNETEAQAYWDERSK